MPLAFAQVWGRADSGALEVMPADHCMIMERVVTSKEIGQKELHFGVVVRLCGYN
jgi:hypothetical protein